MIRILFFLVIGALLPADGRAWGGRGHNAICMTATQLVKDKGLRDFLTYRPQMLGHLCNIPDIHWKNLGPEVSKVGNPTHYIDIEMLGLKPMEVPLDYAQIMRDFEGKPDQFAKGETIRDVPSSLGSIWWRADQFMRRVAAMQESFANVKPPANGKEEQDNDFPYNKSIYDFVVNIGIMGHFVGDVSMPYHSSNDHDGWHAGHGGIHWYYEDASVGQFDGDLEALVLKRARALAKNPPSFMKGTTLERMRKFSALSLSEMAEVNRRDPILKKSVQEKGADGKWQRVKPAERQSADVGMKVFKDMIVLQMARSSLLLAQLWDEAYASVGKPDLSKYRSYRYPFTPDFIPPDYTTPSAVAAP